MVVTKYAFYSKVGHIPEASKQNQDSFIIHPKVLGSYTQHLFGVADGHGQYGKEVSTVVKQQYPALFEGNVKAMQIGEAFAVTSEQVEEAVKKEVGDIEFSGTTCVMVYVHNQELYTANIGDSRAIIGTIDKSKSTFHATVELRGRAITRDHKPDEADEAARVLSGGGRIDSFKDPEGGNIGPLRVWQQDQDIPGLAMTRAIGDAAGKVAGVIAVPGKNGLSSRGVSVRTQCKR